MLVFLKGHQLFIKQNFEQANLKFEKCLKNPKLHHDLLFSLYGQSLCATGRLKEGHEYLLKACKLYQADGWRFEDQFSFDNARNCLDALKHTCHHLNLEEGVQYLDSKLKINGN